MLWHNIEQSNRKHKEEFVDTYGYDLGFHFSYSLTTFAIAMMFATLVPYVPIFAMLFFFFKYYVDKYNMAFVYNSEFRGTGITRKKVVPLSFFNIILVQLVNIGFFAGKMGKKFLWFGVAVIVFEILTFMLYVTYLGFSKYWKHMNSREKQYMISNENVEKLSKKYA